LEIRIFETKLELGKAAARDAAKIINEAINKRGGAYVIAATGASQFEFLDALAQEEIDWSKVVFFHLDEYVGLSGSHPASFRRYLKERVVSRVHPKTFHFLDGEADDVHEECRRVGNLIAQQTIDVAFVGIGENGHLAFIDPPFCDFADPEAVKVVQLDDVCRQQQVNDGAFRTFEEVPANALSLTIPTLMAVPKLFAIAPGPAKRQAIKLTVEGPVATTCPASILRRHREAHLFIDKDSAELLSA